VESIFLGFAPAIKRSNKRANIYKQVLVN
jgi:hypothetical protein